MTYLYHATFTRNLHSIAQYGLRLPSLDYDESNFPDSEGAQGIFVSDTFNRVEDWARKLTDAYERPTVILRFDRRKVRVRLIRDERSGILGDWVMGEAVPPEAIEVKTGNQWVPIREHVER